MIICQIINYCLFLQASDTITRNDSKREGTKNMNVCILQQVDPR